MSLNARTTRETERMVRGSHFSQLPEGALFINTARGILIDQDEMVVQLRTGRFIACLDVTVPEPLPAGHELARLPNVLLTPHVAGGMAENLGRIGDFIADEVARFVRGQPLLGEVTRDRLEIIA